MAKISVPDTVNIEDLKQVAIDLKFNEPLKKIAEECCISIRRDCLNRGWDDYLRGWEVSEHNEKNGRKSYIVHNSTQYQLTHLLENGHLIVNKKGGVGWASPHPHIKPSFDRANKNIENVVKKETKIDVK